MLLNTSPVISYISFPLIWKTFFFFLRIITSFVVSFQHDLKATIFQECIKKTWVNEFGTSHFIKEEHVIIQDKRNKQHE